MAPVRINYYGLIPMTGFAYLVALSVGGAIAVLVWALVILMGFFPPLDTMWSREHHLKDPGLYAMFHNYVHWFIVVCLVGQTIDTIVTLRVFAKKERERRAMLEEMLEEEDADIVQSERSKHIREKTDRFR